MSDVLGFELEPAIIMMPVVTLAPPDVYACMSLSVQRTGRSVHKFVLCQ